MNSALPRISQPVSALTPFRRRSGVLPIAPLKPSTVFTHSPRGPRGLRPAAAGVLPGRALRHCRRSAARAAPICCRSASSCDRRRAARAARAAAGSVARAMRAGRVLGGCAGRAQPRATMALRLLHAHVEHHRVPRIGEEAPVAERAGRPAWPLTNVTLCDSPRCVSGTPAAAAAPSAAVIPGTTRHGIPWAVSTSSSSPPRPKTNGSPPLRRATRLPWRAPGVTASSWIRSCWPRSPDFLADEDAFGVAACAVRVSVRSPGGRRGCPRRACCSSCSARSVRRSAIARVRRRSGKPRRGARCRNARAAVSCASLSSSRSYERPAARLVRAQHLAGGRPGHHASSQKARAAPEAPAHAALQHVCALP